MELREVRVLAIDPGSKAIGLAYFVDDELECSELIRPAASLTWLERMGYIAAELTRGSATRHWFPDVVAIEQVVGHRNIGTALTMAMTVGYLTRVVDELYPRCLWIEVSKAALCHSLGLKGNARREQVKDRSRERFGLPSEDECDAAAIGTAALGKLREANGGEDEAVR